MDKPLDKLANTSKQLAKPFLKWVGGKARLLPELLRRLPKSYDGYIEPMVGGGALALHLGHPDMLIGDLNPELTCTYEVVRDQPEALIDKLRELPVGAKGAVVAQFRCFKNTSPDFMTPVERAARLIYLSKVGFNGLYRVNKKGLYNVPFGSIPKTLGNPANIRACAKALWDTAIYCGSYEDLCHRARPKDLVYLDPPYLPEGIGHTEYTPQAWATRDAVQMRSIVARLTTRGVYVMMSQGDSALIRYLYKWMDISEVPIKRTVSAKASSRGPTHELILTNYSRDMWRGETT